MSIQSVYPEQNNIGCSCVWSFPEVLELNCFILQQFCWVSLNSFTVYIAIALINITQPHTYTDIDI